jgi:arylsulfate sulfotransferase
VLGTEANDWLHANSIAYSAADGNLLVSLRHQDWVVKIAYDDGAGDGALLWRFGPDGDFTLAPDADPFPWQSHQHDASYLAAGELGLYDSGNTRCETTGDCESRGQVYVLNEGSLSATVATNLRLGASSSALGSAQLLANGNLHFNSGVADTGTSREGRSEEYLPDGARSCGIAVASAVYRSFRMCDLYTPPPD